jgi:hypothetical protein
MEHKREIQEKRAGGRTNTKKEEETPCVREIGERTRREK